MPTSILASLATAGVTAGANALFGPKGDATAALSGFSPSGIDAGGLHSGITDNGNIEIKASSDRRQMVDRLASLFPQQANQIAGLRQTVAPGISDFRASRLAEVENARRAAVGNLRENLARRRVLGSSFGQDALTRAESEFAGQRDKVAAESFLQEFEMTQRLIDQEFAARRSEFNTRLDELNLEANVATTLAKGATDQLGANARIQAQLDAKALEGQGKFFGQTWAPVFKDVGTAVGSIFGGGGGAGAVKPLGAIG